MNIYIQGRYGRRRDRCMSKWDGCAEFSVQSVFRSVWFPLSRGSGPAFDGSAARQASVVAAAERESQRCCSNSRSALVSSRFSASRSARGRGRSSNTEQALREARVGPNAAGLHTEVTRFPTRTYPCVRRQPPCWLPPARSSLHALRASFDRRVGSSD